MASKLRRANEIEPFNYAGANNALLIQSVDQQKTEQADFKTRWNDKVIKKPAEHV